MNKHAKDIARLAYIEERLNPKPDEWLYMHLSDLRIALEKVSSDKNISVLDYGCGGSPYQTLFPNANYHKADFVPIENLHIRLEADSKLPSVGDSTYDLILSTQVLEHVVSPETYLKEALRVLRPGGKLAITTHGLFWDHGCPHDYRRWTADGLAMDLRAAGFDLDELYKLTTNSRAILFLGEHHLSRLSVPRSNRHGLMLSLMEKIFWNPRAARNKWADNTFPDCRVVEASREGHDLYIALLGVAHKPLSGPL